MVNELINETEITEEQTETKFIKDEALANTQVITNQAALLNKEEQEYVKDQELKPSSFAFNKDRRGARRNFDGIEEKVVSIKRINKTTKGGRRMRFAAIAVVGDKNGRVGWGKGKSVEAPEAIKKSIQDARNRIVNVKINRKGSVYHEVTCSFGATKVLIKPAPTGTGIIAGGAVRTVLELAGYKDVCSKKIGANATINMIRATLKCLQAQRTKHEIAHLRGKKVEEI